MQFKRFKTKDDAIEWLFEQEASINKGAFIEPKKLTVGDWVEEWLRIYVKPKVRIRTFERYTLTFTHLEPLYNIKVQKLTPHAVQSFYAKSKLSANSINKVHKLLKAALKQALANQYIHRNPLDAVQTPKERKPEIKTFAPEEVTAVLDFCKARSARYSQRYYPLFSLLAMTGARIGEVLGLLWEDVDLNASTIYIKRAVSETATYGLTIDDVKTEAGKRKISIPQSTVEALRELRSLNAEGLVFKTRTGNMISPKNITRAWEELFVTYNKQKKIKPIEYKSLHKLRHTHATTLLADGDIALADVSARLGHAKKSHTLDLYTHARPEQDKKIANKIDELYSKK